MNDPGYAEALYEYADDEFCWNCCALLPEGGGLTVDRPDSIRRCCSERCLVRAAVSANAPEVTLATMRLMHEQEYARAVAAKYPDEDDS